jgi:PAS domain S-box-containing protein
MRAESTPNEADKKEGQHSNAPLWEEKVFQETANFIADAIFCLNTDGYFRFVNKKVVELAGISPDQFYLSHLLDFVHPEYHDLAIQEVHSAIKGKDLLFDLKLIGADGYERIMEFNTKVIYSKKSAVGLLVAGRDRTEQRKVEENLRASEEKYRLFMEDANDAIIVSDTDGYIQDTNRKAEELLGYTKEELYKLHYSKFHLDLERSTAAFCEIIDNKIGGMRNTLMLRKDGRAIPVDITSKLIEYDGHEVIRGSYRDISEHLEKQDRLERMVKKRTAALDAKNSDLLREIKEREQAEERIRNLYHQIVNSQELERKRISYDLHDNVAQDLFSLKIGIDTLFDDQQCVSVEIKEKILRLSGLVKRAIASIREITHALSPHRLNLLGLIPAISLWCNDFSKEYGVKVDFLQAGMDNLDIDFSTEITLYRAIQECLNNVRKHANATLVTIKLIMSYPNIILRIKDDGKGFDVLKSRAIMEDNSHFGIQSIAERVETLNGKLKIESRHMQGTEIMIEIPWRNHKNERQEAHLDNR